MKRQSQDTIKLNPKIIAELKAERDRTSVGPQALLKPYKNEPAGLNHPMITHWLGGRIKTAKREHVEFVKAAWAELESVETVEITNRLLKELRAMQATSGISAEMLVRWSGSGAIGLSVSKIKHCLSGKAKTMRADHVAFMKHVWSSEV